MTHIHWIAERKHQDGSWVPAFGGAYSEHLNKLDPRQAGRDYAKTPQAYFGESNYFWFGALSGVCVHTSRHFGRVATSGFPDNVSEHTKNSLGGYLHSQGHFTVADINRAIKYYGSKDLLDDEEEKIEDILHARLGEIEEMISDKSTCRPDNILFGRLSDPASGETFPDMQNQSNHARVLHEEHIKKLLPIGPSTLRFLIAYE